MNVLYQLYELSYSVARLINKPRGAADTALYPFSVFLISPLVGILLIFNINILPFKEDSMGMNKLVLAPFIGLLIFLIHILVVKKFDFKKKTRERDRIIVSYPIVRKIVNVLLFFILALSGIWIPVLYDILIRNKLNGG